MQDLDSLCEDVDGLEEDVLKAILQTKRHASAITSLFIARDKRSRDKLKLENRLSEVQELSSIKQLLVADVSKRVYETSNRLKEFLALYEIIKNERNKLLGSIQGGSQVLTEMKEKVRLLLNEVNDICDVCTKAVHIYLTTALL